MPERLAWSNDSFDLMVVLRRRWTSATYRLSSMPGTCVSVLVLVSVVRRLAEQSPMHVAMR
jgi:hypothetical protein